MVFSFSEVAISRLLVLNQPNDNENSASLNVGDLEKGEGDGLMWFKDGLWMAWENLGLNNMARPFWDAKYHKEFGVGVFFDIFVEVSSHGKKRWALCKGILQSL